ncbi:MAG TPA: potassium transporter Kup [Caulobacteraceae bacterium]|nr:potassium transporter Kup [Caulobacteraceae bacterium]
MTAGSPTADAAPEAHTGRSRFGWLMLGSMGVVFGDIGTSPLYCFKLAGIQAARGTLGQGEILGIVSLMFWALMIVVTVKYVIFMMRADNRGEGGILSLMALAQGALGRRTRVVLALGVAGAALFYGDAIITPAISLLSATEGLRTAPALAHIMTPAIGIAITLAVLVCLFMVQARGTAKVGAFFGPICLVWFLAIASLGVIHLGDAPRIWLALSPTYGIAFLLSHGLIGLFVLGSVSLTITGAEALYADMGHFGRGPIRAAWLAVVCPALVLNYLGQGAFAMHAMAGGHASADQDWFFLMAPEPLRVPLVILGMAATVIASQAVISGAYSMSSAAMQLGLLPRLNVRRTSETEAGQIFLPTVNLLLMVGVILLVGIFKTSDALGNAYGLSVTGTMTVTTALAAIVTRKLWKWPLWRTGLVVAPLFAVDLAFFSANTLKLLSGGWVPLVIAGAVVLVMVAWLRGTAALAAKARRDQIPLADFLTALGRKPRHRVSGTAVYLTPDPDLTPGALLHNLKHNGVLHEHNLIVTVRTADRPRVSDDARGAFEVIDPSFIRVTLAYGFMERPDVPAALARLAIPDLSLEPMRVSYFLARRSVVASRENGPKRLMVRLFLALTRNSADPSEVFIIPPGRVVEMGVQTAI